MGAIRGGQDLLCKLTIQYNKKVGGATASPDPWFTDIIFFYDYMEQRIPGASIIGEIQM